MEQVVSKLRKNKSSKKKLRTLKCHPKNKSFKKSSCLDMKTLTMLKQFWNKRHPDHKITTRKKENRPHEVLYFHKVDDPYSHLTIHYIDKIKSSFDIVLKPILVGEENPEAVHEPSLYNIYCLEDARRIAPYYDVDFSAKSYPNKELIDKSNSILSSVEEDNFSEIAKRVSSALWAGDEKNLNELSKHYTATENQVRETLEAGNIIRNEKEFKGWADDQVEPIGGTQSSHFGINESNDGENGLGKVYLAFREDSGQRWWTYKGFAGNKFFKQ